MDAAIENVKWVFSGIGVLVVTWVVQHFARRDSTGRGDVERSRRDRTLGLDPSLLRILVIDDKEFTYLELLQGDGFTVERIPDLEVLSEVDDNQYDLILLDLHGVGSTVSKDGGFGILRHLREASPSQLVVAYSAAKWRLRDREPLEMASAVLDKSADYPDFRRTIEELIRKLDDPSYYVECAGVREEAVPLLRGLVDRALLSGEQSSTDNELRARFADEDRHRAASVLRHAAVVGHRLADPGHG